MTFVNETVDQSRLQVYGLPIKFHPVPDPPASELDPKYPRVCVIEVFGVPVTLTLAAAVRKGICVASTLAAKPSPAVEILEPIAAQFPTFASYE